ncbi:DNA ligase 4, partial [Tetrabaena socialis]
MPSANLSSERTCTRVSGVERSLSGDFASLPFFGAASPPLPGATNGKVHSVECSSLEQVEELYQRAVSVREEGVVVKALDQPYRLSTRGEAWLKIKPDYLSQGEFDCVILGQRFNHVGPGNKGGGGVFLVGLPVQRPQPGRPGIYSTFAMVGIGVNNEQRVSIIEPQLRGNLVAAAKAPSPAARVRLAPQWCRATGHKDEWPDWWVADPDKSVVVQVNGDVRLNTSSTFAAGFTLRFPRITRVRTDKGPAQATTMQQLTEQVRQARSNGAEGEPQVEMALPVRRAAEAEAAAANGEPASPRRRKMNRGSRQRRPGRPVARVPLDHLPPDLSEVPVHYDVLGGAFVTLGGVFASGRATVAERRKELSQLVRLLGGSFSANYVDRGESRTSYVIWDSYLPERDGRVAARLQRDGVDILCPAWLPSHAWALCDATLADNADIVDPHGDPYFEHLDELDLQALLERHTQRRGGLRPPPDTQAGKSPGRAAGGGAGCARQPADGADGA